MLHNTRQAGAGVISFACFMRYNFGFQLIFINKVILCTLKNTVQRKKVSQKNKVHNHCNVVNKRLFSP